MDENKVKYIKEHFHTYRAKMLEYLCDQGYYIAKDILERGEDDAPDDFMLGWYEGALDTAIESVDWDALSQCDTCHKYFDPAVRYGRWCSDLCQVDHEEDNDRRDR